MLQGLWFDGRSSRAQPVRLHLHPGARGPGLELSPMDGTPPLLLAHDQVEWPQAWSATRAPRRLVVDLGAHGSLEVDDVAGWRAALSAAGHRPPLAQRMQTRWPTFLAVLLLVVAALGAFYRWGTPWAATQITRQVPLAWELALSDQGLRDLDARLLKPSRLPPARQQELRARFDALATQVGPQLRRYPAYAPPLRLEFRRGLGANAFALPGGTVVLTDGMVELAARRQLPDEALVGVLAHEIGHVLHRHTTRMVVEQGVLNVGLGLALGDVSSLLSVGGSLLTGLAYRRGHESEADCFAVALMRQAGLPTRPMADLLLAAERAADAPAAAPPGGADGRPREGRATAWATLLSSHPGTQERARHLQDGDASGCAR